jgi:hypothetical protein
MVFTFQESPVNICEIPQHILNSISAKFVRNCIKILPSLPSSTRRTAPATGDSLPAFLQVVPLRGQSQSMGHHAQPPVRAMATNSFITGSTRNQAANAKTRGDYTKIVHVIAGCGLTDFIKTVPLTLGTPTYLWLYSLLLGLGRFSVS